MGETAQIIGRVAAGVATGGVSEAVRYGVKQGSKSIGVKRDALGRIISGVTTGGASEVVRYGSKAVGQKLGIDPALAEQGLSLARLNTNQSPNASSNLSKALENAGASAASLAPKAAAAVVTDAPEVIGQTEEEKQRAARLVADKRRKEFQNLGRSSTTLTGPGGLTGTGQGKGKALLGS